MESAIKKDNKRILMLLNKANDDLDLIINFLITLPNSFFKIKNNIKIYNPIIIDFINRFDDSINNNVKLFFELSVNPQMLLEQKQGSDNSIETIKKLLEVIKKKMDKTTNLLSKKEYISFVNNRVRFDTSFGDINKFTLCTNIDYSISLVQSVIGNIQANINEFKEIIFPVNKISKLQTASDNNISDVVLNKFEEVLKLNKEKIQKLCHNNRIPSKWISNVRNDFGHKMFNDFAIPYDYIQNLIMIKDIGFGYSDPYIEEGMIRTIGCFDKDTEKIDFNEVKIYVDKDLNLYCGKIIVTSTNGNNIFKADIEDFEIKTVFELKLKKISYVDLLKTWEAVCAGEHQAPIAPDYVINVLEENIKKLSLKPNNSLRLK